MSTEESRTATHIVLSGVSPPNSDNLSENVRIVTEEWFWHSIRIEARVGETAYYPPNLDQIQTTPNKSINSIER